MALAVNPIALGILCLGGYQKIKLDKKRLLTLALQKDTSDLSWSELNSKGVPEVLQSNQALLKGEAFRDREMNALKKIETCS